MFMLAFGRDVDYHDERPQMAFLNRETGEVMFVYEVDEDAEMYGGVDVEENIDKKKEIADSPATYLEIPGRSHAEHHEIFRSFLDSDWTDDHELKSRAQQLYSGSIGRWIRNIDRENAICAYFDYRDSKIEEMAEEYLRENDISAKWV
jgi:hypothetical protein